MIKVSQVTLESYMCYVFHDAFTFLDRDAEVSFDF